jgi:predicted nucleic acid-binding protein
LIDQGKLKLVWSYILDYENAANPFDYRQLVIKKWKKKALFNIRENENVLLIAKSLVENDLKAKDALHIACAVDAGCTYFITTDDKILNKNSIIKSIEIINPIDMLDILEV